jgi:DNA mismatch endonuclease (patch repair protein)
MDNLTKRQRRLNMSRIKSANTRFEQRIFRELKQKKVRFVTHYRCAIGNPDIVVPLKKKAILLHSDFWHGWQYPRWAATLPSEFWRNKIGKNRHRDDKVKRRLRAGGWKVLIVWEHSIKADLNQALRKILYFLREHKAEASDSDFKNNRRI